MGARGNSGVITSADPARLRRRVPAASIGSRAADLARGAAPRLRRRVPSGDATRRRARSSPWCRSAAEAVEGSNGDASLVTGARRCGRRRARRRVAHARICSRSSRRRASSTRAARGFTLWLDALLEVIDGRPIPEPGRRHDAGRSRRPPRGRRHRRSALRGDVPARRGGSRRSAGSRARGVPIGDSIVVVGGDGIVELPRPHQRHRRRDRGRHRRGPASQRSGSPT